MVSAEDRFEHTGKCRDRPNLKENRSEQSGAGDPQPFAQRGGSEVDDPASSPPVFSGRFCVLRHQEQGRFGPSGALRELLKLEALIAATTAADNGKVTVQIVRFSDLPDSKKAGLTGLAATILPSQRSKIALDFRAGPRDSLADTQGTVLQGGSNAAGTSRTDSAHHLLHQRPTALLIRR